MSSLPVSLFDKIFTVERMRRKAARLGGFAVPFAHDLCFQLPAEPVFVTGTRGTWLRTRKNAEHNIRCGLFPCTLDQEAPLLADFLKTLRLNSLLSQRTSLDDALQDMRQWGETPAFVILPPSALVSLELTPETASNLMLYQGFLAKKNGLTFLLGDLEGDQQLLVAKNAGFYVRVGDYLGLMAFQVSKRYVLVSS